MEASSPVVETTAWRSWDRWWDVLKFLIGTVAVSFVTLGVNREIQHRELELKEQEHVAKFVTHALDQDVGRRQLFAEYFAAVTSSDHLRARWNSYLEIVARAVAAKRDSIEGIQKQLETAKGAERDSLKVETERLRIELQPTPVSPGMLKPRVYFHISDTAQRAGAEQAATRLRTYGVLVPGIELKPGPVQASELRYFKQDERVEADELAKQVAAAGVPARAMYVRGHEESTRIRPRHFELWIARGWRSGPAPATPRSR